MKKNTDLKNKTFGRLTVIGLSNKRGYCKARLWDCQCECGNTTTATSTQLLKGYKKSCGCLRKKSPANVIDLTGKKFGKLTVIERSSKTKNYNALWLCQCECGNTTIANGTSLRRGDTISCGCLGKEQIANALKILNVDKSIDGVQVPLLTKKVRSDSKTGHKGICARTRKGKTVYEVSITLKGKRKYLGSFRDLNKAIEARKEAEETLFKPYIDALEDKNEGKGN